MRTLVDDPAHGRLTAFRPTRAADIAASLAVQVPDVELALIALEADGFVMRGQYPPDDRSSSERAQEDGYERHLLARIHRYTVKRLRREIEPVEPRDFMRFTVRVAARRAGAQVRGPDALAGVLAQLEGYRRPPYSAWKRILPRAS